MNGERDEQGLNGTQYFYTHPTLYTLNPSPYTLRSLPLSLFLTRTHSLTIALSQGLNGEHGASGLNGEHGSFYYLYRELATFGADAAFLGKEMTLAVSRA